MVICAVSDTHEMHDELSVQPGDLFIHAGDILFAQNNRPLSVLRATSMNGSEDFRTATRWSSPAIMTGFWRSRRTGAC